MSHFVIRRLFYESADMYKELKLIRGSVSSMSSCSLKADYSIH